MIDRSRGTTHPRSIQDSCQASIAPQCSSRPRLLREQRRDERRTQTDLAAERNSKSAQRQRDSTENQDTRQNDGRKALLFIRPTERETDQLRHNGEHEQYAHRHQDSVSRLLRPPGNL